MSEEGFSVHPEGRPVSSRTLQEAPSKPIRVQLSRAKGWKMPANTVKVDRSTRWGNPDRAEVIGATLAVEMFRRRLAPGGFGLGPIQAILTAKDVRRELRGKNLACWCALGAPCHADVLLEIANAGMAPLEGVHEALSAPQEEQKTPSLQQEGDSRS